MTAPGCEQVLTGESMLVSNVRAFFLVAWHIGTSEGFEWSFDAFIASAVPSAFSTDSRTLSIPVYSRNRCNPTRFPPQKPSCDPVIPLVSLARHEYLFSHNLFLLELHGLPACRTFWSSRRSIYLSFWLFFFSGRRGCFAPLSPFPVGARLRSA